MIPRRVSHDLPVIRMDFANMGGSRSKGVSVARQQVKSKERVEEHGEVFTNEREVNAMLDLVKQETERIKEDFELLLSLNVFNSARMNDAVYKFKRYEDDSLSYAGIDKHRENDKVGGFDAVITRQEFEEL